LVINDGGRNPAREVIVIGHFEPDAVVGSETEGVNGRDGTVDIIDGDGIVNVEFGLVFEFEGRWFFHSGDDHRV
jgi:hypothetical protein